MEVIIKREGAVLEVNVGHPIVTSRDFVTYLHEIACIDVVLWCGCSVPADE